MRTIGARLRTVDLYFDEWRLDNDAYADIIWDNVHSVLPTFDSRTKVALRCPLMYHANLRFDGYCEDDLMMPLRDAAAAKKAIEWGFRADGWPRKLQVRKPRCTASDVEALKERVFEILPYVREYEENASTSKRSLLPSGQGHTYNANTNVVNE